MVFQKWWIPFISFRNRLCICKQLEQALELIVCALTSELCCFLFEVESQEEIPQPTYDQSWNIYKIVGRDI